MTATEYTKKFNDICRDEFISARDLIRDLDITHPTLMRIRRNPEVCSMKTIRKIKAFVDQWEAKNISVKH